MAARPGQSGRSRDRRGRAVARATRLDPVEHRRARRREVDERGCSAEVLQKDTSDHEGGFGQTWRVGSASRELVDVLVTGSLADQRARTAPLEQDAEAHGGSREVARPSRCRASPVQWWEGPLQWWEGVVRAGHSAAELEALVHADHAVSPPSLWGHGALADRRSRQRREPRQERCKPQAAPVSGSARGVTRSFTPRSSRSPQGLRTPPVATAGAAVALAGAMPAHDATILSRQRDCMWTSLDVEDPLDGDRPRADRPRTPPPGLPGRHSSRELAERRSPRAPT